MKKLITMATALLLSVGAYAQHEVGSVTIQPKVGMNIASITDIADEADPSSRVGFVAGAEAEWQFSEMFSLSGGLLYSMQGGKADGETIKADYLNVPIMANCYIVKGLAVKLGIQPGFNINAKWGDADIENAKTFDFSIPVGLSYEFANIQLDARYNWGLTKILDAEGADSKNSVFQITLGYKFEL